MMRALLLAFAILAAPALAQAPAEAPPPAKAPEAKTERRSLNLRLDNPSSFATVAPPEKEGQKALPALGGDARRVEPPKREGTAPTPGGPFPKDTNPNL